MFNAPADFHPSNARRVLVVDSDLYSAQALSWAMEHCGYEVQTCTDDCLALDRARNFMPGVVLMSIGAPQMSGLEACRQLRQDPALAEATIVAQTGWGTQDMRRRTAEAGFDHHLTKPLDLNSLLALIQDHPHA